MVCWFCFKYLESTDCAEAGGGCLDSPSRCLHAWALWHIDTYVFSMRFRRPAVIRMCAWAHQRPPPLPSTRVWVCVRVWIDSSSRLTSCKPWNKLVCDRRRDLWWLYRGGNQRRWEIDKLESQWTTVATTVACIPRSLTWWRADDECL